ncbi:MAG: DNA topoisomerase 3, partial [Clostridiales bacterium]|nr:DNA topoisomerase 3 [Clostridiales bacterium]
MKTLVIAEKPSVGRDIARVLQCDKKGDGYLFNDSYIVSWAIGHLVTLCEPDDYNPNLKQWSLSTLPIIPETIKLKAIDKTKGQLAILSKLMNHKDTSDIICATDSGREGELIFRYIYDLTKCTKPFKRLWISSMTDAAITDGFSKLKNGSDYDALYQSAKCRSEADWLVGINATRAFTKKYNALLSIGRVQTPTLAIMTQRQKEIDAFVPKDYWEIKAQFEPPYQGIWYDMDSKETKIPTLDRATEIQDKTQGKPGFIKGIETEKKSVPPPNLYDLTELQRDANKKYGFSAKKTLDLAQDLYEKRKLITYPRTDSRHLSDDMIPKLPSIMKKAGVGPYAPYAAYTLSLPKLPITGRIVDNAKVTDHHAIIPSEANVNLNVLTQDEALVYDLIVRRFFSVFYPNYIYNVTKMYTDVQGEIFLSKGKVITQIGWMELYPSKKDDKPDKADKSDKSDDEATLPDLKEGDQVLCVSAEIAAKKTTPPSPYTEATLLSAMENAGRFVESEELKEQLKESGLGTPATRAATIERLLAVGYIERKGKSLIPTQKGMLLIDV